MNLQNETDVRPILTVVWVSASYAVTDPEFSSGLRPFIYIMSSTKEPIRNTDRHYDNDVEYEKATVVETEQLQHGKITAEEAAFLASFTDEQKKTVLRKVDWRLVPVLLVLYLISFIDRANIGERYPGRLDRSS